MQPIFSKASVQAAMINTIPAFLVAIVGIIITWSTSEKQLKQSEKIFLRQLTRDSLLNIKQDSLTSMQLELIKKEFEQVKQQTKQDSISLSILKYQNQNLILDRKFINIQNKNKLSNLTKQLWEKFQSIYKITRNDTSVCKLMPMKNIKGQIVNHVPTYDFSKTPRDIQNLWAKEVLTVMKEGLNSPNLYENKPLFEKWNILMNDMEYVQLSSDKEYKDFKNNEDFGIFYGKAYNFHFIDLMNELNKYLEDNK